MIVKSVTFALLLFLLAACHVEDASRHSAPDAEILSVQSPEFALFFFEEAKRTGLKVELVDETEIRYKSADVEKVHHALRQAAARFLPPDRSTHYPEALRAAFVQRLKEGDISFRTVVHSDEEWIVWDESDGARVRAIQEEVEIDYAREYCCEDDELQ